MGLVNLCQPMVGAGELAAVADVFASNWLGYGPQAKAFEAEFAEHLGVVPEQTLLINSGTSGLFITMELLNLGTGDDVVLPSVSFVAAGNAVAASGARPVFCDVDPRTLNPTAAHIEAALTPNTRAVVVLHFGGYPGDIEAIAHLCRSRGITLVEDSACSVASRVDGRACGTFGDIALWSFDAMKILVTGDGGMLYVRDAELAERARRLAQFGMADLNAYSRAQRSKQWWEIEVLELGRRVIGNDVIAGIGRVQLRRLADFVNRRAEIVRTYDRLLGGLDNVQTPPPLPAGHESSHYFYWVQTEPAARDKLAADLLDAGVYSTFKYWALHRVPIYGATHLELPGTDQAAAETLLLPLHQGLSEEQTALVADTVCRSVAG